MEKQLIISVGREFGSGGHVIAEALAERFGLPLYDNNLLEQIADERNLSQDSLKKYDEMPKNRLFSRTVRGYSNSMPENIAQLQFDFLKKKAENGESFVVVGRCAETKLKDCAGLVSLFILGDREVKAARIQKLHQTSRTDALRMMDRADGERKAYHNYHCKGKWGDSRNYDLSINSSKLGLEETTAIIERYIKARQEQGA